MQLESTNLLPNRLRPSIPMIQNKGLSHLYKAIKIVKKIIHRHK